MEIIESLRSLIGQAPPGLDFLEYLFAYLLVFFGLFLACWLIKLFFNIFRR